NHSSGADFMRSTRASMLAGAMLTGALAQGAAAQNPAASAMHAEIERRMVAVMPKVVAWRRDIHEHPELSGEEVRTAALVAAHLEKLGIAVQTGVGGHGVVGILRGGRPGPVVALRADMDALPVAELVDLPFKSTVRAKYRGQDVGVMHACGHDNHVAVLMGAAEVLAGMKATLPGTVKFVFQPAEEGAANGEGGAAPMIRAGVLTNPQVDAIFGMHVFPGPLGSIGYRAGPLMAASNTFTLTVRGRQTHGAAPWAGVDPIVVGSQIVLGLQTIISRQTDITAVPAIVTVGTINGGIRSNIIPDSVVMIGTIRTFDPKQRSDIFARMKRTAEQIAMASGATAGFAVDSGYPVTVNDSSLTNRMLPTLRWAAGDANAGLRPLVTGAEDFSYFQEKVPGLFVLLGVTPKDKDPATVAANHSPYFFADEGALPTGVRAMAGLAVDFLAGGRVTGGPAGAGGR
ncbi:MAG TPA: amidohydrolase, partial [Gemmatimonadaceae bacterium]|nr:amidohydrolase [Gemmatimonadaceae bacterium]